MAVISPNVVGPMQTGLGGLQNFGSQLLNYGLQQQQIQREDENLQKQREALIEKAQIEAQMKRDEILSTANANQFEMGLKTPFAVRDAGGLDRLKQVGIRGGKLSPEATTDELISMLDLSVQQQLKESTGDTAFLRLQWDKQKWALEWEEHMRQAGLTQNEKNTINLYKDELANLRNLSDKERKEVIESQDFKDKTENVNKVLASKGEALYDVTPVEKKKGVKAFFRNLFKMDPEIENYDIGLKDIETIKEEQKKPVLSKLGQAIKARVTGQKEEKETKKQEEKKNRHENLFAKLAGTPEEQAEARRMLRNLGYSYTFVEDEYRRRTGKPVR